MRWGLEALVKILPATLLVLALAIHVPTGLASQDVCAGSACASYGEGSFGDGSCDAGEPDHYAYRGYSVTYTEGSTTTGVYVVQTCWSSTSEEQHAHGSSLLLSVSRMDVETWRSEGAYLSWDTEDWNGERQCGMTLHGHVPVGPSVFQPLPCPLGLPPPAVLPALP